MDHDTRIQISVEFLYNSVCEKFKLGSNVDDIKSYLRKSGIDDATISSLLGRYFEESNDNEQDDVLTDSKPLVNWYGGPQQNSDSHWARLQRVLIGKKNWSKDMIENLDSASTSVVARLSFPNSSRLNSVTHTKGLVLGYVQSGKTANYSAVISKAIDAGYKLIVVLAGVHNNLRYQTEVRLKEEIVEPNETSCITLTRTDKKGDFSKTESTNANKACGQNHGFSMAVIKKNVSVLRSFNSWLSAAKPEYLQKCPILIIDDESDQASINMSKDPELNPSAINSGIRKIMNHFKVASYVGYTATPFANMLVDASIDDDLYPRDFFISLRKPSSYTGAEELFGSFDPNGKTLKPGLPIVRTIDFDEANHIRTVSKPKSTDSYVMGENLKIAIDGFLVSCACRIARKQWNRHFSMLVHCSQKISIQQQLFECVQQQIEDTRFQYLRNDSSFRRRLQILWEIDYVATTSTIDNTIQEVPFEALWKNIQNVIDQIQVVLDNSASENRLSYESKFWGIIIGGNTLSRGLTLEGLMTSYFVRTSDYYDSLMQMGRWFGYRRGYIDLVRIYMTDDLKERFFHLANVENEIREEIHAMAENDDRPIDVGTRIRTHPTMKVTNAMKMRSAATSRFTFSCTKIQPTYHNLKIESLKEDAHAVQMLLSNVRSYGGRLEKSAFTRFQESALFRGVPSEVILQFLDCFKISPANIRFSPEKIADYITQVSELGELNDWSVVFVSKIRATEFVQIDSSLKVGLSDRSVADGLNSELDPQARYIARVATPIDEFIDLGDQVKNCPTDVDNFSKIEGIKRGPGYFRRKYRPKGRGLLMIYPINPNSNLEERATTSAPYPLIPLKAPDVVFGVCFVFPETASDRGSVNYVINKSINKISSITPKTTYQEKNRIDPSISANFSQNQHGKVIHLSKLRFQSGLQCAKRLYLEIHSQNEKDIVTSAEEAIFELGKNVGELARKLFPKGSLVDFNVSNQDEAYRKTQALLKDDKIEIIYEAAFTYEKIEVRVDILRKVSNNEVDIIAVKSSTRVKEEHLADLAIQAHVIEGSGMKIRKCFLMHINSDYLYDGADYILDQLFTLSELTNEVKSLQDTIEDHLTVMWAVVHSNEVPAIDTGPHCSKPYQCSFHQFCRKDWPKDHITNLPRASDKLLQELSSNKITRISEIPENFKGLTFAQQRVRQSVANKKVYYEKEMLTTLSALESPLFFIDFETINPALPLFKNSRPFQQLPFQWSCHKLCSDGSTIHGEFLAAGDRDPRSEFAVSLFRQLGTEGPILVYSAFEKTCLLSLADHFPQYQIEVENICGRMIDLLALVRKHFYHPDFNGSFSIKKVLPTLVPELSYKDMEIGDGATAAMSFLRVVSKKASADEAKDIRRNLLEYCKLDTLAMVKIYLKLLDDSLTEQCIS